MESHIRWAIFTQTIYAFRIFCGFKRQFSYCWLSCTIPIHHTGYPKQFFSQDHFYAHNSSNSNDKKTAILMDILSGTQALLFRFSSMAICFHLFLLFGFCRFVNFVCFYLVLFCFVDIQNCLFNLYWSWLISERCQPVEVCR